MIKESYYLDYFNNLLEGNKAGCTLVIQQLASEKAGIIDIYVDLFQRSLYQIGKMWDKGKITVAEEHNASQLTESLMNSYFNSVKPSRPNNKTVIISCINKEFHEIGARMAAHIFESSGWNTFFLGASVPPKELVKFIKAKQPDIVGLSFNFYLNFLKLVEVIDHIRKFFPRQKIIIGGQGIKSFKEKLSTDYPDVETFESIADLNDYIKNYNG